MNSMPANNAAANANSEAPSRLRRVLIPLDGSEYSRQILPLLLGYFAVDDVELVLLRVANVQEMAEPGAAACTTPETEMDEEVKARLEQELVSDAAVLRGLGFTVNAKVAAGNATKCIIEAAARGAIDVIALASDTTDGASSAPGSSVGERLMRNVSVPVLLLRAQDEDAAPY